jgi:hypothetical protein
VARVSPPPEPSPIKGEGKCCRTDVATYLPLSALSLRERGGEGLVGAGRVLTGPMLPYAEVKTALERVMTSEEHQFQSQFPEGTADVHRRTNSLPAWIAEKVHNTL